MDPKDVKLVIFALNFLKSNYESLEEDEVELPLSPGENMELTIDALVAELEGQKGHLPIVSVVLEGGVIQECISEIPVQIMIIDHDCEGADPDEMAILEDTEGVEFEALSSIWDSAVNPEFCLKNEKRLLEGDWVYCPECLQMLRGAENATSVADHGRCFDCHKKWQNGELEETNASPAEK